MTLPLCLFVTKPDSDFLCSKCSNVLHFPVIDNCGHKYCVGCVVDQKKETGVCIISSQPLTHYTRADPEFIDRIYGLEIYCPYCGKNPISLERRSQGCDRCAQLVYSKNTKRQQETDDIKPNYPKLKYPPPETAIKLTRHQLCLLEHSLTLDPEDDSLDSLILFLNLNGILGCDDAKQVNLLGEKEVHEFLEHYEKVMQKSKTSQETSEGTSTDDSFSSQ